MEKREVIEECDLGLFPSAFETIEFLGMELKNFNNKFFYKNDPFYIISVEDVLNLISIGANIIGEMKDDFKYSKYETEIAENKEMRALNRINDMFIGDESYMVPEKCTVLQPINSVEVNEIESDDVSKLIDNTKHICLSEQKSEEEKDFLHDKKVKEFFMFYIKSGEIKYIVPTKDSEYYQSYIKDNSCQQNNIEFYNNPKKECYTRIFNHNGDIVTDEVSYEDVVLGLMCNYFEPMYRYKK